MDCSIPSDEEVIQAVKELRQTQPNLGRAKMLEHLKTARKWTISEARLKKLVPSVNHLHAEDNMTKLGIPKDALEAQQHYKDNSTRVFKIYGRGEYNYGVSPCMDQGIRIEIAHNRLVEAGRPQIEQQRCGLAQGWPLRLIWDNYVAAAGIQD